MYDFLLYDFPESFPLKLSSEKKRILVFEAFSSFFKLLFFLSLHILHSSFKSGFIKSSLNSGTLFSFIVSFNIQSEASIFEESSVNVRKLKNIFSLLPEKREVVTQSAHFTSLFVKPEPCEDDDLEAEADSPDMEPGTEMDQGELSK